MGIFASSKRCAEQAAQARLTQGQANANRLRMFMPGIAAGLDSEGYRYAQRAIGALVALAGWPSLVTFVYQLGVVEYEAAKLTNEEEGRLMDRAIVTVAARVLLKAYAEPVTLADLQDMQTISCTLMVWWGLSDLAEPHHSVVRLMRHFGGYPFKSSDIQAIEQRFDQIRTRITPEAHAVWKQAEREMGTYGNGLSAS
ncbi:MAG TPA: hypothetical protein VJ779_12195 [Acetobacteraceae bacterium]|nr:hypothetical protein [Acetobacteraceae bacterium]